MHNAELWCQLLVHVAMVSGQHDGLPSIILICWLGRWVGYTAKALVGFVAAWRDSLMLINPSTVGELRLSHTMMMYIKLSVSTWTYSKRAKFACSMHCTHMHVIDLKIAFAVRVGVKEKCSSK